ERDQILIESPLVLDDRSGEVLATPVHARAFVAAPGDARSEFARGFVESPHFLGDGRRALDERRMRRFRLARATRDVRKPLAAVPALLRRVAERRFRFVMLVGELQDRLARLVLPQFELTSILFEASALARAQFLAAREALALLLRPRHLQFGLQDR